MRFSKTLVLVSVCGIWLSGCSKKDADSGAALPVPEGHKAAASGAELIPGEKEVQTAMSEKNYSVAVQHLIGMQSLLVTPEQHDRWSQMFGDMRSKLTDESAKDPKAAEALVTLRAMRNGR